MKIRGKIAVLTLAMMSLFVVSGCGNENTEGTGTVETRVVSSAKGEVEIPKDPKRIVDISGSSEELILMGYTPVGTANIDSYQTDSVPSYVKEELGGAKVVGHAFQDTADIEGILSLDPDLIIIAPRQEKIYSQLKEIAPVVMMEDYSNDWEQKLKEVGKLFEQEEKAELWLEAYDKKAEEVGKRIQEKNGEKSYLTVLPSEGQFMVFTEGGIGTVLKEDMNLAQPNNMPDQEGITLPTVSAEGLLEIDADHIVVIVTESDKVDLEKNQVWQQQRSVKEGNVTYLNASPFFSQAYNPIGRELILTELEKAFVK